MPVKTFQSSRISKSAHMSESKIKSIQANGTFESQYGTLHKYECELEDGVVGEVATKQPDRWKVGDEVEYTKSDSNWGVKLKLNKPGMANARPGGSGSRTSPEVQKRIDASWAIGQGIALLGSMPVYDPKSFADYNMELEVVARTLLKIRDQIAQSNG
jgi:hypothetical protein